MIDFLTRIFSELLSYYILNFPIAYLRWRLFAKRPLKYYLDERAINITISISIMIVILIIGREVI